MRRSALDFWKAKAASLAQAELDLHRKMPKEVAHIMRNKKLVVFSEMLGRAGFPNIPSLMECLTRGFPLVGKFPTTQVLPEGCREQIFSTEELERSAPPLLGRVASKT